MTTERIYWALAFLLVGGILYAGVKLYEPLLTGLHILVCVILILVVLLQSGRAADLAGAFGGAGSQTAFGPRGAATFLSKATTFLAVVFMLTSLALAIYASGLAGSTVAPETPKPSESQPAPAQPQPQPTPPAETPAPPK